MVLGWRRAFCTSIPKDQELASPITKEKSDPSPSPKLSSRLSGLFSNSSTPRFHSQPASTHILRCRTAATPSAAAAARSNSAPRSPRLQCLTRNGSRFFQNLSSAPSSPRSPSTFSFFKPSLGRGKSRCGLCLQRVKTGQGMAIFTAACGHNFHYPCISAHVKNYCPICNSTWNEMHLLNTNNNNTDIHQQAKSNLADRRSVLKVYNDDEPLSSPTTGSPFSPIPESDEFPGFPVASVATETKTGTMEIALLPEAAIVSVRKTYAVVLRIKAPANPLHKAPIDLVAVLNVSRNITAEKMYFMKKSMRLVVSSLAATDRLSIVAYSSTSKRLLPLRRMTIAGKRAARKIIAVDRAAATSATDSLKKAAKVLEDRREINSATSILLFADSHLGGRLVSSTRFTSAEIPLHCINLSACVTTSADDTVAKYISPRFNVVIQDLRIQLGFKAGSSPGEISAVYSYAGRPAFLGSGSSWCRVGELYSEEKRELLVELKVPSSYSGTHKTVSIRCSYKDPSTQQHIFDEERSLSVQSQHAVGSSTYEIQRIRCLFVSTRAVAESRRMSERGDLSGAQHLLASARDLVLQSGSGAGLGEEFVLGLEAELADLNHKRQDQLPQVRSRNHHHHEREATCVRSEEKAEPITTISAWRAAERLAKVAIMRKSLNRVSDLHGFENARF